MAGANKSSPSHGKGQKTLLSFFQKSSTLPKKELRQEPQSSKPQSNGNSTNVLTPDTTSTKHPTLNSDVASEGASEPSLGTPPENSSQQTLASSPLNTWKRRKRKLIVKDSDSENSEGENGSESDDDWNPVKDHVESDVEEEDMDSDPIESSIKATTSRESGRSPVLQKQSLSLDKSSSLAKFSINSGYSASTQRKPPPQKKVRMPEDPERYKWLLNIKDADGHSPDHPDYDSRTLYIPNSAWAKFTPFEKQYWEIKQNLWNTVVFFKKGKFYELYENDADIAHRLFDLKLAGGGRANMSLCGVPEMSFNYWASAFIAKGYKVARVDQAETALGKEMRDIANKKKEEKIIRRELSCVLTGGTLTDAAMLVSDLSQYCMSIKQDDFEFAACFVDTATSQFYVSHFEDKSTDYPLLESLLAQIRPKELVLSRGNLDRQALKVIKNNTSTETLWEMLKPDTEFWNADKTRQEVVPETYFGDDQSVVPAAMLKALNSSDLCASALGGLIWYLRTLKLDKQLLSLGQFNEYDVAVSSKSATMVLDGQTLQNLEVFANSWDGGSHGTLFKLVNQCVTPFGKRRLRSWITHPLQRPEDIRKRADVVDMFMLQDEVASVLSNRLVGLPDTERMLSRVHAGTLRPRDFVRLIGGLDSMANLLKWLQGLVSQIPQLEPFVGKEMSATVASIEKLVEPWLTAFDHVEAKNNDRFVPQPGVDEEFDITRKEVEDTELELKKLLSVYRKQFKTSNIEFRDSGKEIYLIELPAKLAKEVPSDWQQMGATAKLRRYWSPEVKCLVRTLQEAQERHNLSARASQQKLYESFCSNDNYTVYMDATKIVSAVDCLLSLAKTSQGMAIHCRPEILEIGDEDDTSFKPVIEFTELRHPVATTTDFIPNDVYLGGKEPRLSLLTGANAAGKSTLLRTTCCAILLAQLGCHVPAQTAKLTPVDRIMTRLGASDNIFAGKSTFHVELAETERILSEASSRSFVVIDELGRGGSSNDGFAIAEAVLHHLATHVGCMGFFATHYATLYNSFASHPQVKPERMAIMVDREKRDVTFLYKLENGRSEGSFGMNVALMCGVSQDIVKTAEEAAVKYEHTELLKRSSANDNLIPLGLLSDAFWLSHHGIESRGALEVILSMAEN